MADSNYFADLGSAVAAAAAVAVAVAAAAVAVASCSVDSVAGSAASFADSAGCRPRPTRTLRLADRCRAIVALARAFVLAIAVPRSGRDSIVATIDLDGLGNDLYQKKNKTSTMAKRCKVGQTTKIKLTEKLNKEPPTIARTTGGVFLQKEIKNQNKNNATTIQKHK